MKSDDVSSLHEIGILSILDKFGLCNWISILTLQDIELSRRDFPVHKSTHQLSLVQLSINRIDSFLIDLTLFPLQVFINLVRNAIERMNFVCLLVEVLLEARQIRLVQILIELKLGRLLDLGSLLVDLALVHLVNVFILLVVNEAVQRSAGF